MRQVRFSEIPERQRILHQALRARTLPAVAKATEELCQWVQDNPDDVGIVDAFEQLAMMEEALQGEGAAAVRSTEPELVGQVL